METLVLSIRHFSQPVWSSKTQDLILYFSWARLEANGITVIT